MSSDHFSQIREVSPVVLPISVLCLDGQKEAAADSIMGDEDMEDSDKSDEHGGGEERNEPPWIVHRALPPFSRFSGIRSEAFSGRPSPRTPSPDMIS
jgi:hypothetical protein